MTTDHPSNYATGFPTAGEPRFDSIAGVRSGLAGVDYLADEGISGVVYLADRLAKPILVEGPAGTGKTELAKSVARMTGSRLIRLQCYEGLDESKALYEWNYKKQLLRIQADSDQSWQQLEEDIFSEEFLLARPLLEAIRSPEPVVLLVDEVDRVELETEALLLEILSEYQVSIPELGTVRATQIPLVFLTSNNTRELSEALKRRCLYLHIDYPDLDRERAIIQTRVPGISAELADQVARIVRSIRTLELKKSPSVSETLDWARTLVVLGVESIDAEQARDTLHILLKYRADIDRAAKELASVDIATEAGRHHARCPLGVRLRAAGCRHPGLSDRASRRGRSHAPRPLGGPRGAEVRLGRQPGEVLVPLARLRNRLRGLLLLARPRVRHRREQRRARPTRTAPRRRATAGRQGSGRGGGSGQDAMTPEELAELLYKALLGSNDSMITAVARHAVARFAGMEAGRPVGGTYYLYRTLRNLDLDGVMQRLMEQARPASAAPARATPAAGPRPHRAGGTAGARRVPVPDRQAAPGDRERDPPTAGGRPGQRGAGQVAAQAAPRGHRLHARHQGRAGGVARALQPLSRKLAVRLARKRRHGRKGPLDFRSTVRHSLSTGGVPVDPRFKYPRPSKPEIVVIADISGSVASFARFTLHLVHAIASQFSKVRSFVFIDGIDEVTRFFEGTDDPAEAVHRINTEADVVWVDGHSDYGHALTVFWERWGEEINAKSSVLLLGDARNNYHASHSWVVKEIQKKARHVYWLNPEPRAYWDSGDSIVGEYAIHCDDVVECRTLRQLERFVGELA